MVGELVHVRRGVEVVAVQVGLADVHGVVADIPQRLHVRGPRHVDLGPVGEHAVIAYVPFGEERRACRHAERSLAVHPREPRPFVRETVEVGRLDPDRPRAAEEVGAVLVRHHHDDVGRRHASKIGPCEPG